MASTRFRENNRRRRARLEERGIKEYSVTAHKDDIAVIRRFAANLLSLHDNDDSDTFNCTISTVRPIE